MTEINTGTLLFDMILNRDIPRTLKVGQAWRTLLAYTAKNLTLFGSSQLIKTQIASILGKKFKFINSFPLNFFFLPVRRK